MHKPPGLLFMPCGSVASPRGQASIAGPVAGRAAMGMVGLLDRPIAYPGYPFTFGVHDSTILARSLIGVIALPILVLAQLPALTRTAN